MTLVMILCERQHDGTLRFVDAVPRKAARKTLKHAGAVYARSTVFREGELRRGHLYVKEDVKP